MEYKVHGDVLVGFGDYFSGYDELGAPLRTPPLKPGAHLPGGKPPKRVTPSKKVPVKKAKSKKGASPHRLAFGAAAASGAQAIKVSKHVKEMTAQYKNRVAKGQHTPLVKTSALRGSIIPRGGLTHVGAAVVAARASKPGAPRVLTQKQRAAVAKHNKTTALLARAKKAAAVAAQKAGVAGNAALAFVKKAKPLLKTEKKSGALIVGGAAATRIHGILGLVDEIGVENLSDHDLLGIAEVLGLDVTIPDPTASDQSFSATPPVPDPNNPGYLTDGSPDPSSGTGDAGPVDASGMPVDQSSGETGAGAVTDPDGNVLYDPATDPEIIPMPERGLTPTPDDMAAVWADSVPEDGVLYTGPTIGAEGLATVFPKEAVGSWHTFFSNENVNHDGFSPGFLWSVEESGMQPQWLRSESLSSPSQFARATGIAFRSPEVANASVYTIGMGPLVGNPKGQFKNLQYSMADNKFFWQGQFAPPAMCASADAKIKDANAATVKANRAAALAVAKQMFADRMQQAEQLAKQNADNALAESAATSQAAVAASQQATAQGEVETQAQQALVTQQQADTAAQTADTESERQAAAVLIQQAQQDMDVDKQTTALLIQQAQQELAHPEQYPAGDEGGEYAEEGGSVEEGYYGEDEGAAMDADLADSDDSSSEDLFEG